MSFSGFGAVDLRMKVSNSGFGKRLGGLAWLLSQGATVDGQNPALPIIRNIP